MAFSARRLQLGKEFLRLHNEQGHSYAQIARFYGITKNTAAACIRDYRRHQGRMARVHVSRPQYTFGTQTQPTAAHVPRFDGQLTIEAEHCVVVGDVHVPTTDWQFAARVAQVAEDNIPRGERVLIIAGDLLNVDALSKYDHLIPPIPLAAELSAARELVGHWLDVFDKIYVSTGNHDDRVLKSTRGELSFYDLWQMISTSERVTVTPYPYTTLISSGEEWHITHPANYSKNQLKNASELAEKHRKHIISWHEHHAAIGRDLYNHQTIVNGGGLFDPDNLAYVMLRDSTSARMKQGFVYVCEGTAHLLTPHASMTDWRLWTRKRKTIEFPKDEADEQAEDEAA